MTSYGHGENLPLTQKRNEISNFPNLSSVINSIFGLFNLICYTNSKVGEDFSKRTDENLKSVKKLDKSSSGIGFVDILELNNGTRRVMMSDVSSSYDGSISIKRSRRRTSSERHRRGHFGRFNRPYNPSSNND